MPNDKLKITQKEFDDIYQIEEPDQEITGDTKLPPKETATPTQADEDTTPFLTQEEEDFDSKLHDDLPKEDDN